MAQDGSGFGVGARLPRKEDARHLRGRGRFVADIAMPGAREAAFARSPIAHGRLRTVRKPAGAEARVLAAEDLPRLKPLRAVPDIPGFKACDWPALATGKVRFVGECVAICLGDTRAEAEDLAQQVALDIEPLPAVTDALAARDGAATLLHEHWGDNVFVERPVDGGDIGTARAEAAVTVTREYRLGRQVGNPMEGRGVLACWDHRTDELVIHDSCQAAHMMRTGFAEFLGLQERQVRVIAPDVGGAFGVKNRLLPEEVATAAAALALGVPVRWIEDRREHLLASPHAREIVYRVTAYADRRGLLLGVEADITVDAGAYSPWPMGQFLEAGMASRNLPGPYALPHYRVDTHTVATNKPPMGPFRGVARPGACLAIERTVDEVARAVGREPWEVRRDNMVRPEAMPYRTVAGMVFDNGDYPESLRRAVATVDLAAVRARQRRGEPDGRSVGVGFACYAEQTAHGRGEWVRRGTPIVPGYEFATVRFMPDGTLQVMAGAQAFGQGLETTLAQVAHQELGIHPDRISVRFGDSALAAYGLGSFASRSMVMAGGAVQGACRRLAEKIVRIGGQLLQCAAEDVVLAADRAAGPGGSVALAEIGRSAYLRQETLPPGMEPTLEASFAYEPALDTGVYSYATHAAVVAADAATGIVELLDYVVVEDSGAVVNPTIVDGQIVGGVAQGIGTALLEEIPYDPDGQPLAVNLAEYLLPGAADVPSVRISHMVTPAETTAYGVKGMGEGGAIAPPAAIANALSDAFAAIGAQFNRTPLSPRRIAAAIAAARETAVADADSA